MNTLPDPRDFHATAAQPVRGTAGARLRAYFLTGVVVAGPVAITVYLTTSFVAFVDRSVKPLIPPVYLPETYLPFAIPGFGLLVAFVALTLLGFLTANLVGRTLISLSERLLDRMPIVRGLYKSVKQIFETVFSSTGTSFRRVGLVQYPVPGTWSIVFISADPGAEMASGLPPGRPHVGVFLPCSPNPTTGFFFYLPKDEVVEIGISVDEAAKLVMSAGLIQPEDNARRPGRLGEGRGRDVIPPTAT